VFRLRDENVCARPLPGEVFSFSSVTRVGMWVGLWVTSVLEWGFRSSTALPQGMITRSGVALVRLADFMKERRPA